MVKQIKIAITGFKAILRAFKQCNKAIHLTSYLMPLERLKTL